MAKFSLLVLLPIAVAPPVVEATYSWWWNKPKAHKDTIVAEAVTDIVFVDTNGDGSLESAGDLQVWNDKVYNYDSVLEETVGDEIIGTSRGRCMYVGDTTDMLPIHCEITLSLVNDKGEEGKVMIMGDAPATPAFVFDFAIVGGTGAYFGANGEATLSVDADGDVVLYVYDLRFAK